MVSSVTAAQIDGIARRQLAGYDAHRPGLLFADAAFCLTIEEAYQVQMRMAALRTERGEPVAGYKIGCVSRAVQRQLGLDRPVFGHLFATEMYRSGVVIDAAAFDGLAIEGEFAVRMGVDVPDAAWLRAHPDQAVCAAFAVIELHNNVFRGPARTPQELIANNALHAGVVLPLTEGPLRDAAELVDEPISVFRNGELLGTITGSAIPGGPLSSVVQVAEQLETFGLGLKRDQLLLTGSPLPLYRAAPGDRVLVRTRRLPEVELRVGSPEDDI